MFRKIAHTFQTSVVNAVISFLTIWLIARFLGAEGQGAISLLLINVSVIQVFASIVGGSALVYLVPRYGLSKVLFPSFIWAIISSVLISLVMFIFSLVPKSFLVNTVIISLLQALILNNIQILIAKDNIAKYNLCRLMQPLLVLLLFILQLLIYSSFSVNLFLTALYGAYSLVLILSGYFVLKGERFTGVYFDKDVLKLFIHVGGLNQVNNVLQLANYRFTFYIIEKNLGIGSLGVFSLGISLTEAVWLLSRSISTIHHGEVSRSEGSGMRNTLTLMKVSFWGTIVLLAAALLLPEEVYTLVFGSEFRDVKKIILLLSPGVAALAPAMVVSYYFSAIKKLYLNTISSGAGSLVIIIFSFLFIPQWGIQGAAIANSLSYLLTSLIVFVQYRRIKSSIYNGLSQTG